MKIIGFGHRSRVGKDTCTRLAKEILETHAKLVEHKSFAGVLKDTCHRLYGWAGVQEPLFYERLPAYRSHVLPKIGKTVVELWIEVGNKLREVYPDTWVSPVFGIEDCQPDVLLISDVRYLNEIKAIRERGGVCIKVTRESAPRLDSPTDNALEGYKQWDAVIENEGTERDLVDKVKALLVSQGCL